MTLIHVPIYVLRAHERPLVTKVGDVEIRPFRSWVSPMGTPGLVFTVHTATQPCQTPITTTC